MLPCGFIHFFEHIAVDKIVGINEREIFSAGFADTVIARIAQPAVRYGERPDTVRKLIYIVIDDRLRLVCRAVINDNDLKAIESLSHHRVKALREIVSGVVYRDNDGNIRRFGGVDSLRVHHGAASFFGGLEKGVQTFFDPFVVVRIGAKSSSLFFQQFPVIVNGGHSVYNRQKVIFYNPAVFVRKQFRHTAGAGGQHRRSGGKALCYGESETFVFR